MKTSSHIRLLLYCMVFLSLVFPLFLFGQTQTVIQPDDNMAPADFNLILKDAWSFLKDITDTLHTSTAKKSEFETTPEFEKRILETRKEYLKKITDYVKDKKLDQRVFGILLKASLQSFNADAKVYKLTCLNTIEAPYNIPILQSTVTDNPYVGIADSIRKGYRASSIYLKFNPTFNWPIERDAARTAKGDEASIYFKVRFVVDLNQKDATRQARLSIIPKQILLINQRTNTTYWQQTIR
ncbi:MAG: hypothetical protein V1799_00380 [bacterium]